MASKYERTRIIVVRESYATKHAEEVDAALAELKLKEELVKKAKWRSKQQSQLSEDKALLAQVVKCWFLGLLPAPTKAWMDYLRRLVDYAGGKVKFNDEEDGLVLDFEADKELEKSLVLPVVEKIFGNDLPMEKVRLFFVRWCLVRPKPVVGSKLWAELESHVADKLDETVTLCLKDGGV